MHLLSLALAAGLLPASPAAAQTTEALQIAIAQNNPAARAQRSGNADVVAALEGR